MSPTHDHTQRQNDPEHSLPHSLQWDDRLQDGLDGDLADADAPVFEAHLAGCELCQQRLADFEQLASALQSGSPRLSLNETFDVRLFAQIDAIDETQRAAARHKVEQELQNSLHALSRSWRRTLTFVVTGVAGGLALAFALMGYFDVSGLTGKVVAEGASELGGNSANLIHIAFIAAMGASIGGVMAGWLTKAAE